MAKENTSLSMITCDSHLPDTDDMNPLTRSAIWNSSLQTIGVAGQTQTMIWYEVQLSIHPIPTVVGYIIIIDVDLAFIIWTKYSFTNLWITHLKQWDLTPLSTNGIVISSHIMTYLPTRVKRWWNSGHQRTCSLQSIWYFIIKVIVITTA